MKLTKPQRSIADTLQDARDYVADHTAADTQLEQVTADWAVDKVAEFFARDFATASTRFDSNEFMEATYR